MKTFQEFINSIDEESCSTSSIAGAESDGTKKPKEKDMSKRKDLKPKEKENDK